MYHEYGVTLSDGQKQSLAKAFKDRAPLTLRLGKDQLAGDDKLMLTQRQLNKISGASAKGVGVELKISKTQMRKQTGGFLGPLLGFLTKTIVPTVAKIAPKVLAPLATGALSGLASTGIGKLFGSGMVPIDPAKKDNFVLLADKYLTKKQKTQLQQGNTICLTKKQQQDGGFLPFLLGALAPAAISAISGLFGKGLQVDAAPQRYRMIPRTKKKL